MSTNYHNRISALRQQFKAERISIQRDANRHIGHINTAIGQVSTPEAREALRAERARIIEATRQSMRYNRICYTQQSELLQEEHKLYLQQHPSKSQLRRAMALLSRAAQSSGNTSLTISFGDNQQGTVTFGN